MTAPALQPFSPGEMETTSCPVCGQDGNPIAHRVQDKMVNWPGTFTLHRCRSCGTAYLNPRPTETAIGRAYAADFGFHTGLSPAADAAGRERAVTSQTGRMAILKTTAPCGTRVLDVGSGDGAFLLAAHRAGYHVLGMELDAQCRRVHHEAFGLTSLAPPPSGQKAWPLKSASLDVVCLWSCLEHLHHPKPVLEEAARVLKPGGAVIVCVPNYGSMERRVFQHHWQPLLPPLHLTHFTPGALQHLFTTVGLHTDRLWFASTATSLLMTLKGLRGGPLHQPDATDDATVAPSPTAARKTSPKVLAKRILFNGVLVPTLRLLDRLYLGASMLAVARKPR